jgi:small subunit ribosomal protein S18
MYIKKKPIRKPLRKGNGFVRRIYRKKPCKFCLDKIEDISYLDYLRFQKFMTERGKIMPSRITGTCTRHQRQLSRAIRRARVMALVPFVAE